MLPRGPHGSWAQDVKWLASLNDGRTIVGHIGDGNWHALKRIVKEENVYVTQLRMQYHGVTIHGIRNADAYTCKAAFAANQIPAGTVIEQAVLGSQIDGVLYLTRLSRDGQIWQDTQEGGEPASVK